MSETVIRPILTLEILKKTDETPAATVIVGGVERGTVEGGGLTRLVW